MSSIPPRLPFPQAFMRERARYQLTRHQIAQHVGVAQDVVKRWERGEAVPNIQQFKRLISRLPRIAPHAPEWARFGDAVFDGRYEEHKAELDRDIAKLDARGKFEEKPEPEWFGIGLKRVREENDVTQAELGEILGLTGPAVAAWENEVNCPVEVNLDRLYAVLPELKAGIETGAIKRPPTRDLAVPTGGRGFPRQSTVDQALEMVLAQSDEERARPPTPKVKHEDPFKNHLHRFDADEVGPSGVNTRRVCSICGEGEPDPKRRTEIRTVQDAHEHKVKRCPCGGSVSPSSSVGGKWVCAKCFRLLAELELIDVGVTDHKPTTVGQLAEAYGRARLKLVQAHRAREIANLALVNADTAAREAAKEVDDSLALLDLAVSEEVK